MSVYAAETRLYANCPTCSRFAFRIDHLKIGQSVTWACDKCGTQFDLVRQGDDDVCMEPTGKKNTPLCVTLVSDTVPPIEMKVNTWNYAHSQGYSPEEFFDHEKYFYEEHTCPTNWLREVEQMTCEGDHDPHGLFRFVSVEPGHFKTPGTFGEDD
jgi:hypothetical protein